MPRTQLMPEAVISSTRRETTSESIERRGSCGDAHGLRSTRRGVGMRSRHGHHRLSMSESASMEKRRV